jgi:non-homologous end joining protein Ku
LRDRSRWDEVKVALDMLSMAEQLIDNMASEGDPNGT